MPAALDAKLSKLKTRRALCISIALALNLSPLSSPSLALYNTSGALRHNHLSITGPCKRTCTFKRVRPLPNCELSAQAFSRLRTRY